MKDARLRTTNRLKEVRGAESFGPLARSKGYGDILLGNFRDVLLNKGPALAFKDAETAATKT